MIFTWATATDPGLVRDHNEDAVAPREMGVESGTFVVGVADGMGGHVGGEVASRLALEAALALDGTVVERVEAANRAVAEAADATPALRGMGTTLTLARFDGDSLEIGHVGDSRALIMRNGELEQITTDHSLVAEMVSRGEITSDEAQIHPYRNVITRALGLQREVEVDREQRELEAGDIVLIASDGLTGMVEPDDIQDILLDGAHPSETVWTLIEAANAAGGMDNISVAVVGVANEA
jgi:protein phosphatase